MVKEQLYKKFAKYYDKIYSYKDYAKEIEFLDTELKRINAKKILDIACGTGTHAKLLKQKGYEITGMDINPEMLKIAKKKVKGVQFLKGDMKKLKTKQKYDAILCLFTAICYNKNLKELEKTLKNFYNALNKGGIAIFDVGVFGRKTTLEHPQMFMDTYSEKNLQIARVSSWYMSKGVHKGAYLIFVKDKGRIDFEIDEHDLGTFDKKGVLKTAKSVGFKAQIKKFAPKSKRPVFVCKK